MENEVRWTVRLPKPLRDALRRYAAEEHRSLNGQLVAAVEEYVRQRESNRGVAKH